MVGSAHLSMVVIQHPAQLHYASCGPNILYITTTTTKVVVKESVLEILYEVLEHYIQESGKKMNSAVEQCRSVLPSRNKPAFFFLLGF